MLSVLSTLAERNVKHPLVVILGCREDVSQVFVVSEDIATPVNLDTVICQCG